jgi:hypothetical protein
MAGAQDGDKGRYVYGPRPLGGLMPAVTRPAFRRRAPAAAQIMADWPAIVGPALAQCAEPRRFAAGTLTLACTGSQALALQHLAPALIERINGHLGTQTVTRLRFVQAALPAPAAPPRPPPAEAPMPDVAGLPPGELGDALRRLARAILTEHGRE